MKSKIPFSGKGKNHSKTTAPFPFPRQKKNNFLSLLREESPKTEHTVQLFEFLRYDAIED